jgi:glycosyltransferase involved in cell wall biosynthesis
MAVFENFCAALAEEGRGVTLRPHPGGQYVLKNKVALPANVVLNNNPIYKVDLSRYAYGISAPSSVLIDMALAKIPVGVWRDGSGVMDTDNYDGLTEISSVADWRDFSREASAHPERFIERQRKFLDAQMMPLDPADIYRRFARLLDSGTTITGPVGVRTAPQRRIMFVANGFIPTLQLSFFKPLAPMLEAGEVATDLVTEKQMKDEFGKDTRDSEIHRWLNKRLALFRPTVLVFCRYSGPHAAYLTKWARREGVPVVFHVDDDLLNVPAEIGVKKHRSHNEPRRLATVRHLLEWADLVYCSNERLKERFKAQGFATPMVAGRIYCSGEILVPARERRSCKVGYMGFDHAHDFEMVLPTIIQFLRRTPDAVFELFGSIPKPASLDEFGERISLVPPIRNYDDFLREFSRLDWDIGICPLAKSDFNLVKADTKWVEYTSVGIAVIASRDTVYDECCADGCGILAETPDEWLAALETLSNDPSGRRAQVDRAQAKLRSSYSTEQLREQIMDVLALSRSKTRKKERVLFVANDLTPTLQLSFVKPLAPLLESGEIQMEFLTGQQMRELTGINADRKANREWILERLAAFKPTMLIFCRYNGKNANFLIEWARQAGIPVIFHIDDDLLSIPADIGAEKYAYHNQPAKLASVRHLLEQADLVYCSNERLKKQFRTQGFTAPMVAGSIYASGKILAPAVERPVRKIGYMASADHAHNLDKVLPAITEFLRSNPEIGFELFGSIPKPAALEEFGNRITTAPPIRNYEDFLVEFARLDWDIGICPLAPIHFNMMKSNTKWVEYTSIGAAVIASRDTVYDECCADGCGILASTHDEWLAALQRLTRDPGERFAQVSRAQKKLAEQYSTEDLRDQVLEIFARARSLAA